VLWCSGSGSGSGSGALKDGTEGRCEKVLKVLRLYMLYTATCTTGKIHTAQNSHYKIHKAFPRGKPPFVTLWSKKTCSPGLSKSH